MDGLKKDIFDLYKTVNLNGKTVMFRLNDIDFTGVVDGYLLNKGNGTGSIALKNIVTTTPLINATPGMFFVRRDTPPIPTGGGKTRKRKRKRNKTKRKKTKKN